MLTIEKARKKMPKELTHAEYEAERAAKHCPRMCVEEWIKNPYSPVMICPGCTIWVDEDGKVWRRINFMRSESEKEDG